MSDYFWESLSLDQMNYEQWESLCDGCAKCCLVQLEDEDSQQLVFTNVACDLLDGGKCKCTDYDNRSTRVPTCMTLNAKNVAHAAEFAPPTCAYRLLVENRPLPDWHPLIAGSQSLMHELEMSVRDKTIPYSQVSDDELEEYVVEWPGQE